MTTKTDDLKPCPCCGGEAAFNTTRTTCRETIKLNKRDTGYGVNCVVCGINNRGLVLGYESKALAAEAWNRRAALQSQDAEDAQRYRKLRAMATQQADSLGPIFRIDVRRSAPYLFNFDAAIDHARRVEGDSNANS